MFRFKYIKLQKCSTPVCVINDKEAQSKQRNVHLIKTKMNPVKHSQQLNRFF